MQRDLILRRLAFIKYLFNQANGQALLAEPMNTSSLLTFHDAIELFLQLSAEKFNIKKEELSFMNCWDKLKVELEKVGKSELTQKESMRRLNRARVDLKHHGIMPSKADTDGFKVLSSTFFEENCKNVFDVDIKDISLVELVTYPKVKEHLLNARSDHKKSNHIGTLENLAIAFELLIKDYEKTKKNRFGESPFFFGKDMTFLSSFSLNIDRSNKLSEFVDNVKGSIESIRRAVKILSFGIDYRKYVRFSILTPNTISIPGRDEPVITPKIRKDVSISKEDFEYCFNFVIESAIKLQEFDFELYEPSPHEDIKKYL
ncbi:MAG: hypothetical protein JXC85_00330 [Candidatus Aenigmarchaeota archaeon]|nr:hypothetical protein [Candidatus Aenigmarchaeota archaeon]